MSRWAVAILVAAWMLCGCRFLRPGSAGSDDAGLAADVDVDSPEGQGYLAVEARQCGQCHQSPNPSDGLLSGQDSPVTGTHAYDSNLTPDPDTGMDAWDAGTIATSVLNAVGIDGGRLCAMPAYADAGMGTDEALSIGAYLKTLAPVRHPVPASACSR